MRKRRSKQQLELVEEKVLQLLIAGFSPYAIHQKVAERADLLNGIISRLIEKNPNIRFKFDVVSSKMTLGQINNDPAVNFYRYEIDESGAILLFPIIN